MPKYFKYILFLTMPLLFLSLQLYKQWEEGKVVHTHNQKVIGTIFDKKETRFQKKTTFSLFVEYEWEGIKHQAKSSVNRSFYSYSKVGDQIEISIHPTNRAIFDCKECGSADPEMLPLYMITFVLIFLFGGYMIWRKKKLDTSRSDS